MTTQRLIVTQIKSKNGRLTAHKRCLVGLGIRKINRAVEVADTVENRGMIEKISYMLRIQET